ncbi:MULTISPECIES: hypothetical protein [unclassified Bacillus (in: firmicutes)]|uniref:hypothetical protein n=1 Tax=unclassified Bacillus (in: firmicutes) TaxID=185979 RepID=UPI0015CF11FB|nr:MULTISPECIES: hypothetical protein [unclassified Bacillus (in: firmicutes)]
MSIHMYFDNNLQEIEKIGKKGAGTIITNGLPAIRIIIRLVINYQQQHQVVQ